MIREREIDVRRYTDAIKKNWKLYAISAVVMLGMATFYSLFRMDQYEIYGDILIESENGGTSGGASLLGGELNSLMRSFSLGSSLSKSADNEAEIIASPQLVYNAVVREKFNHNCIEYDGIFRYLMYKDCPVTIVTEPEYEDTIAKNLKFLISLNASGDADIKVKKGLLGTVVGSYNGKLPAKVKTIFGSFIVMPTDAREPREYDLKYVIANRWNTVGSLLETMEVSAGKKTDIVTVNFKSANRERGMAFNNAIFDEFLNMRRIRKNKVTNDELAVINDRLAAISTELSSTEKTIEQFKSKYDITDLPSEVAYLFRENKEVDNKVIEYRAEQSMLKMALATLRDKGKYSMLPMMNMGESATNSLVTQYNDLIVRRMTLLQSAKEDNAALRLVTKNIDAMRSVVIESIEKANDNLEVAIKTILAKSGSNNNRLQSLPAYEREYYDLMRNQMFTNQLYLFLLQKRENSMLKIASADEAGNVIQPAYSDLKPSSKKSIVSFIIAIVMILLVPTIIVLWKLWRKDILLGEYDFSEYDNAVDVSGNEGIGMLRHDICSFDKHNKVFVYSIDEEMPSVMLAERLFESFEVIADKSTLYVLNAKDEHEVLNSGSLKGVDNIERLASIDCNRVSLAGTSLDEAVIVEHKAFRHKTDSDDTNIIAINRPTTLSVLPEGSIVIIVSRLNKNTRAQLRDIVATISTGVKHIICYV